METKAGVKTSEFYITVAAVVVGLLHDKLGITIDPMSLAAVMSGVVAYIWSRVKAKAG